MDVLRFCLLENGGPHLQGYIKYFFLMDVFTRKWRTTSPGLHQVFLFDGCVKILFTRKWRTTSPGLHQVSLGIVFVGFLNAQSIATSYHVLSVCTPSFQSVWYG